MIELRVCPCGRKETLEVPFYKKAAICRPCYIAKKKPATRARQQTAAFKQTSSEREKTRRRMPQHRAYYIVRDSLKSDRRNRRPNDLTVDFVEALIKQPCRYCGETRLKMTLDRKDNATGHTQVNVLAACIRCNYFRRDMPYVAWSRLVPEMQRLRVEGLLDGWKAGAGPACKDFGD